MPNKKPKSQAVQKSLQTAIKLVKDASFGVEVTRLLDSLENLKNQKTLFEWDSVENRDIAAEGLAALVDHFGERAAALEVALDNVLKLKVYEENEDGDYVLSDHWISFKRVK